jgi:hypothetical protein
MALPVIKSAFPKRRYQFGEFLLVVLGEIESGDNIPYHFLLGVIPDGANTPELFISAEKCLGSQAKEGVYQMRIIADKMSQTLNQSNRWCHLDEFVDDALTVVAKLLNLVDEEPVLLW